MRSIAVIGQGFVGGALTTVFLERDFEVYAYDKCKTENEFGALACTSVRNLVEVAEEDDKFTGIYFVCVPTPMMSTGQADISIVDSVLKELAAIPGERIAVIKSTIPPGSVSAWNRCYGGDGLRIVYSPEFLTEANALEDMRNQKRIILGGPYAAMTPVRRLMKAAFPGVPIIRTTPATAEMVKYMTNIHLATRVVLSCELAQICEAMGIDYDTAMEYAAMDPRLGGSHMDVPGADGVPGARGHCLPKDLNALMYMARSLGVQPTVMDAVWRKNLEVIPDGERDWERMKGRAVAEEDAA